MRRRVLYTSVFMLGICVAAHAHDIITTPVTWNREMVRIFYARCVSCHHEGGPAFSLAEYKEAYPWKTAIKEEVLERRMPPWGAVKGFGDFRNDQALTPEQIELITSWAQGGAPEGDPKDLPPREKLEELLKESAWFGGGPQVEHPADEITASGDFTLTKPFVLDGLLPKSVPSGSSFQIIAEFPDGRIEPLFWLNEYKNQYQHPFLFREPLVLPPRTAIRGIPDGINIVLLPAREVPEGEAAKQ